MHSWNLKQTATFFFQLPLVFLEVTGGYVLTAVFVRFYAV